MTHWTKENVLLLTRKHFSFLSGVQFNFYKFQFHERGVNCMPNFGIRVCQEWMHFNVKNFVELACLFRNSRYAMITIHDLSLAFQVKMKNWSTSAKHEKLSNGCNLTFESLTWEGLSSFIFYQARPATHDQPTHVIFKLENEVKRTSKLTLLLRVLFANFHC